MALLVLVGCKSSGSGGSSSDAGPKDLTVGLLVPLTGPLGSWGADWQRAYQLAADEINESGLLPGGGEVKVVVEDEGGNPEQAIRAATKMIQVNHVAAILGPTSDTIIALNQLASSNQVPVVSPAAGTVRLDTVGGEWLFRTYPSDSAEGVAVATYFREQGLQTAALMAENQESPQGIVKVFGETFKDGGGTIADETTFDSGQSSYEAELQNALGSDPELLYLAAGEESARTILRELSQAGFSGQLGLNGDLTSKPFLKDVGADLLEGACSGQATPDTSIPEYQRFKQMWEAAYDSEPYVTISNAYDSMIIVALAAVAAGSNTGEAIQSQLVEVTNAPGDEVHTFADGAKALEDGSQIDYQGASGPLDFNDSGTSPLPFTVYCVQGGSWQPVKTYPAG
ncbi:MAG: ABC transporter substrate-binding protein [Candidatus Velamenicoccus archaeovorus]